MICVESREQHCIKAAGGLVAVLLQKVFGSANQFLLLGNIDAGSGTAKAGLAAHAHLNKNNAAALLHDEVYFAKAATIIACQQ